ncbi:MAG: LptF/LptG family permease, partial [candidate division WOR-3 bacterium]
MRVIDRHLLRELVRFALLALFSVVVIYLLIDLFEELAYFTSRKVSLLVLLRYYLYSLPSAVSLLYPVSLLLAVFVVYGQMTRNRELHALQSAGVRLYRLFVPGIGL